MENNPKNKEYYKKCNFRPIRLSYHGRSHYNSIKPIHNLNGGLIAGFECGKIEGDALLKL